MGILNVTPDSFSDGGAYFDPARALAHGRAMIEAGADIVDIGGESTRPGSDATPLEEELRRVVPIVAALARDGAVVSVDTRRAAGDARGARCRRAHYQRRDGAAGDADSLAVAARSGAPLMLDAHGGRAAHHAGGAAVMTMSRMDVLAYLQARVAACEAAGIRPQLASLVDPGIGFGKHLSNTICRCCAASRCCTSPGCAVLLGLSRKRFIGRVSRNEPAARAGRRLGRRRVMGCKPGRADPPRPRRRRDDAGAGGAPGDP